MIVYGYGYGVIKLDKLDWKLDRHINIKSKVHEKYKIVILIVIWL